MKTRGAHFIFLLACALTPVAARAEDAPPPASPDASVYVGSCLSPALNGPPATDDKDQMAFVAAALGAAIPSLIGSGLDWIGAQLAALGADKKTAVFGTRATETTFGDRTCVSIVRFAGGGQRLDALLGAQSGWADAESRAAVSNGWTKSPVPRDRPIDFLAEFWVRPSKAHEVVSLIPTLLYYPRQLTNKQNGNKDAAIAVTARLAPSGDSSAAWTWALPRQTPLPTLQVLIPPGVENQEVVRQTMGALRRSCETACDLASPWTGNPWAAEKKGGAVAGGLAPGVGPGGAAATAEPKATNVRIEITEIRDGSPFFRALAAAFTAAKPALQTGLEQATVPSKRADAEATAMTAKATALTAYATKLTEVDAEQADNYCAAKGKAGANWTALSSNLQAKQLLANVAAQAAGVSQPFPTPIPISAAIDAGRCS